MYMPTTLLSLVSVSALASAANTRCANGEIAIGTRTNCFLVGQGWECSASTGVILSNNCGTIDASENSDYCNGGWHGWTVSCSSDGHTPSLQLGPGGQLWGDCYQQVSTCSAGPTQTTSAGYCCKFIGTVPSKQ
ncbi:hypothetical protein TsFJ059_004768 [Trichoderma semiorbis]|uniref:Uncharacterized protein n=1 Tax=Trichoderma semiorbis TaxID=1491008 RepID=A0A9P8HWJ6_9HYPO|nr:hypothetical protein TsFJ059_004768 [Trichoderma semiorbis]